MIHVLIADADPTARKALAMRADPRVLAVAGTALSLLDDESADRVIAKALATDGSSAFAWGRSGWNDVYRGNDDAAIERQFWTHDGEIDALVAGEAQVAFGDGAQDVDLPTDRLLCIGEPRKTLSLDFIVVLPSFSFLFLGALGGIRPSPSGL